MDYTYFCREVVGRQDLERGDWTSAIVAYNVSARVQELWSWLPGTTTKIWALHSEYGFGPGELPQGTVVSSVGLNEAEFSDALIQELESRTGQPIGLHRLVVDITGFMRPELVCLVQRLRDRGAKAVDFLYIEPMRYQSKGWTTFSRGSVRRVRQVLSCEGASTIDSDRDVLLLGTGYDDVLMSSVANHKRQAKKRLLMGFPSLAPDMYQENVWRVSRSSEEIGSEALMAREEHLFAPANDPFVTAQVVSAAVADAFGRGAAGHVYLSPLGTKVQALGFALFYAMECLGRGTRVSVLLPFTDSYEKRTSEGFSRTWRYSVDLQAGP